MEKSMLEIKVGIAATMAACTALWGWFGWLVLLWLGCLLLDFVTGSMAAAALGSWSSKLARQGVWHKLGSIIAVMVAAAADLLLGMVTEHVPGFPLEYSTLLCPMVIVWYIIEELGSMMENAVRLGAPVPDFLKKALQVMKEKE